MKVSIKAVASQWVSVSLYAKQWHRRIMCSSIGGCRKAQIYGCIDLTRHPPRCRRNCLITGHYTSLITSACSHSPGCSDGLACMLYMYAADY